MGRATCACKVDQRTAEVQVLLSAEWHAPDGPDKQFLLLIPFTEVPGAAPHGRSGSQVMCRSEERAQPWSPSLPAWRALGIPELRGAGARLVLFEAPA